MQSYQSMKTLPNQYQIKTDMFLLFMSYILFSVFPGSDHALPLHLSSLFPPSLPLELSDAVCLCLPLQEVWTKCWHASLSSPTSTSLVPAVSSILPLSASAGLLHPHQSVLIPNLRSSAGDGVGTGLRQLSALPEHPSHNAPHFPPSMLCAPPPWHPGAVGCWFLIGQ